MSIETLTKIVPARSRPSKLRATQWSQLEKDLGTGLPSATGAS